MTAEQKKTGEVIGLSVNPNSPVAKFEAVYEPWLDTNTTLIENGSSEEFEKFKIELIRILTLVSEQFSNPNFIDIIRTEFDKRANYYAGRRDEAQTEEKMDKWSSLTVRYDALATIVRGFNYEDDPGLDDN